MLLTDWTFKQARIALLLIVASSIATFANANDFDTGCWGTDYESIDKNCKNGDIMIFVPQTFGNEQYPVIIAGTRCDFEYPIVQTVGGVSCVYSSKRLGNISDGTE